MIKVVRRMNLQHDLLHPEKWNNLTRTIISEENEEGGKIDCTRQTSPPKQICDKSCHSSWFSLSRPWIVWWQLVVAAGF